MNEDRRAWNRRQALFNPPAEERPAGAREGSAPGHALGPGVRVMAGRERRSDRLLGGDVASLPFSGGDGAEDLAGSRSERGGRSTEVALGPPRCPHGVTAWALWTPLVRSPSERSRACASSRSGAYHLPPVKSGLVGASRTVQSVSVPGAAPYGSVPDYSSSEARGVSESLCESGSLAEPAGGGSHSDCLTNVHPVRYTCPREFSIRDGSDDSTAFINVLVPVRGEPHDLLWSPCAGAQA